MGYKFTKRRSGANMCTISLGKIHLHEDAIEALALKLGRSKSATIRELQSLVETTLCETLGYRHLSAEGDKINLEHSDDTRGSADSDWGSSQYDIDDKLNILNKEWFSY
jgi:hypothetical protein